MYLGELLVAEGIISPQQLESALGFQRQYGGRLGSALVELQYVSLDVLAQALGRQHGVPAALQKHFDAIDPACVRGFPPRAAQQHGALPLGWSTKTAKLLIVAFMDPHNMVVVDEVSTIVRARVQAAVAPELRMLRALERWYGIRPVDEGRRSVSIDPHARAHDSEPVVAPTAPLPQVAVQVAEKRTASAQRLQLSMPPPSVSKPVAPIEPTPPPVSQTQTKSSVPPDITELEVQPSLHPVLEASEAIMAIAEATTRDEVGIALTDFLGSMFGVGLVMIVKDGAALGWMGFAPYVERETIESIAIPLSSVTMFQRAYESRQIFLGQPPAEGAALQSRMWKLLRTEPPREVLVAPVVVQQRVVNLVYGHPHEGTLLADDAAMQVSNVCEAAAAAYLRLIRSRAAG